MTSTLNAPRKARSYVPPIVRDMIVIRGLEQVARDRNLTPAQVEVVAGGAVDDLTRGEVEGWLAYGTPYGNAPMRERQNLRLRCQSLSHLLSDWPEEAVK